MRTKKDWKAGRKTNISHYVSKDKEKSISLTKDFSHTYC